MALKPMLLAEVHARALRASPKRESERGYGKARDAPDKWAGRGRVQEWKALVGGTAVNRAKLGREKKKKKKKKAEVPGYCKNRSPRSHQKREVQIEKEINQTAAGVGKG